jgi:hypothetical protein
MVMDCAAQFDGKSLNSEIYPGPKMLNDLVDVLLRFRRFPVAIIGDISEMFLQIELEPEDRKYYRIIWDGNIFEYQRTFFGDCSSTYKANAVVKNHAKNHKDSYPEAAETVEESQYVDDALDSRCTVAEGKQTIGELSEMFIDAGMTMRKLQSSHKEALEGIATANLASNPNVNIEGQEEIPTQQKVLGVVWMAEEDKFTFKSKVLRPEDAPATRRGIFKCMAKLFDPLGLIDPYRIQAWIIYQKTWVRSQEWDNPFDEALAREWYSWVEDLQHLGSVRIERHIGMNRDVVTELHMFCDASKDSFGAAVYTRTETSDGQFLVRLVMAKARLSPLKAVSIARLELCGAVVATRLAEKVKISLESGKDGKPLQVTYWTDSMNVLYWICRPGKECKPYVANRVGEIQTKTTADQWRHVPTKKNPADIASRGSRVQELIESKLWWKGPDFLQMREDKWPNKVTLVASTEAESEKSPTFAILPEPPRGTDVNFCLHPCRWSNLVRLARRIGFVRRIISWILKKPLPQGAKCWTDELTPEEFKEAEDCLVRQAQKEEFPEEITALSSGKQVKKSSPLASLSPFFDVKRQLLRLRSCLEKVEYLNDNEKYPVFLPRKGNVTRLVIQRSHDKIGHPVGKEATDQIGNTEIT